MWQGSLEQTAEQERQKPEEDCLEQLEEEESLAGRQE
jgi:hypothetical protein